MDLDKRKKEAANQRFMREELGALLKLFSSLGITVALGIVGFFLVGLLFDRYLKGRGMSTYGLPLVGCTLFGIALTIYWSYLRINKHLRHFAPREAEEDPIPDNQSDQTLAQTKREDS